MKKLFVVLFLGFFVVRAPFVFAAHKVAGEMPVVVPLQTQEHNVYPNISNNIQASPPVESTSSVSGNTGGVDVGAQSLPVTKTKPVDLTSGSATSSKIFFSLLVIAIGVFLTYTIINRKKQ